MVNEKQIGFIEKLQLKKPRLYWKLINENRKLYNDLCRECQTKTVNMQGNIKPADVCDKCRSKTDWRMSRIREIIEKAGGRIKDDG